MSKTAQLSGASKPDDFSPEVLASLAGGFKRMFADPARAPRPKVQDEMETFVPVTSRVTVRSNAESTKRAALSAILKDTPVAPTSNDTYSTEVSATATGLPFDITVKVTKKDSGANGGKGPSGAKVSRIRPTDIAFPSGNDILDHSPNAPFKLDERALKDGDAPTQIFTEDMQEVKDRPDIGRRLKMQQKVVTDRSRRSDMVCMFEFGRDRSVRAFVLCDPKTRQWLRAHPLFNAALHVEPHVSQLPFRIEDVPGRGKGLVATRLIAKGECVLREPPLLVSAHGMHAETMAAFHQNIDQYMHYRTRIALDSLDNCHEAVIGVSPRIGILRTNAIAIKLPTSDEPYGGVFELLSRLNHSCDQNVTFRWSYKDFQGSIWADRAILPGEELVINYADNPRAPKKMRQAELMRKFKFVCTCKKCGPA